MKTRPAALADRLYFLTTTVVSWQAVFIRREYSDALMDCLAHCCAHKGLTVYAYVLMPNHLHAVVESSGRSLSDTMRDFKSYSAKRLVELIAANPRESRREELARLFSGYGAHNPMNHFAQFWHNGFAPFELFTPAVIAQKIHYIHQNPVRAGFVSDAHHWFYSSAHPPNPLGVVPPMQF